MARASRSSVRVARQLMAARSNSRTTPVRYTPSSQTGQVERNVSYSDVDRDALAALTNAAVETEPDERMSPPAGAADDVARNRSRGGKAGSVHRRPGTARPRR